MPSRCRIEFDKPDGVYNSGETLTGTVKLETQTCKMIRGVSITMNGIGKVRLTNHKNDNRRAFKADDQYLNSVTFVIGSYDGHSFELPAGLYTHKFRCLLPAQLPTSCKGKHGHIRYEVIVRIDRQMMFDNVFKQIFTVIQPLNLNMNPVYRQPQTVADESKIWKCCIGDSSAPVTAEMSIPFTGYVSGEIIAILLTINNESNEDIDGGKVKLTKRITFESSKPKVKQAHIDSEICSQIFPSVLRLTKKEFRIYFELPSLMPSTPPTTLIPHCVRTEYILSAFSAVAYCRSNMTVSIPITIGSVPLDEITTPTDIITQQPTGTASSQSTNGTGMMMNNGKATVMLPVLPASYGWVPQ